MAKTEALIGGGRSVSLERGERKASKKKLHRLEVSRAKNGGHVVRHHYMQGAGAPFNEPVEHVFGKGEGAALMAHLGRHLAVKDGPMGAPMPMGGEPAGPEEPGGAPEPDADDAAAGG